MGDVKVSTRRAQIYSGIQQHEDVLLPVTSRKVHKRLAPGVYTVNCTENGSIYFTPMSTNCDAIVELPSKEYQQLVYDMETFLIPNTKDSFNKYGFIYKRSALLHGKPGVGKTVLVNRIMHTVIKQGGIVLFNPPPGLLQDAYTVLEDIQPDVLTMVIFEEFDELLEHHEEDLLSLLDGEIQKSNIIYLATTNYKENIPTRLLRPGRFSSIIEVLAPNLEARIQYLLNKHFTKEEAEDWASKTEGFTVDDLKEVVLSVKCLNYSLEASLKRVVEYKTASHEAKSKKQKIEWPIAPGSLRDRRR